MTSDICGLEGALGESLQQLACRDEIFTGIGGTKYLFSVMVPIQSVPMKVCLRRKTSTGSDGRFSSWCNSSFQVSQFSV